MSTTQNGAGPTEILDHITDGVVSMDADLRYTHVNQPAALFLQRTKEEMLGNRIEEVFPEIVEREFYQAMLGVRDGGKSDVKVEEYYPPTDSWYAARFFPNSSGGVTISFQVLSSRVLEQ
ncbi:MAG: PAS domain-containing protein, partial [Verrucomicrobiota bacterium]